MKGACYEGESLINSLSDYMATLCRTAASDVVDEDDYRRSNSDTHRPNLHDVPTLDLSLECSP